MSVVKKKQIQISCSNFTGEYRKTYTTTAATPECFESKGKYVPINREALIRCGSRINNLILKFRAKPDTTPFKAKKLVHLYAQQKLVSTLLENKEPIQLISAKEFKLLGDWTIQEKSLPYVKVNGIDNLDIFKQLLPEDSVFNQWYKETLEVTPAYIKLTPFGDLTYCYSKSIVLSPEADDLKYKAYDIYKKWAPIMHQELNNKLMELGMSEAKTIQELLDNMRLFVYLINNSFIYLLKKELDLGYAISLANTTYLFDETSQKVAALQIEQNTSLDLIINKQKIHSDLVMYKKY